MDPYFSKSNIHIFKSTRSIKWILSCFSFHYSFLCLIAWEHSWHFHDTTVSSLAKWRVGKSAEIPYDNAVFLMLYSKINRREPIALNLWNLGCPAYGLFGKNKISLSPKSKSSICTVVARGQKKKSLDQNLTPLPPTKKKIPCRIS